MTLLIPTLATLIGIALYFAPVGKATELGRRRKTFAIQVSRAVRVRRFQDPIDPESLRPENLPKRPPPSKVSE